LIAKETSSFSKSAVGIIKVNDSGKTAFTPASLTLK